MPIDYSLTHRHTLILRSDDPYGGFSRDDLATFVREIDRLGLQGVGIFSSAGQLTCTGDASAVCLHPLPTPRICS